MTVSYNENGGSLCIELFGELGHHEAIDAMENISALYECVIPKEVILDLGGLSFMDSTGVGLLIGRYKKLNEYCIPAFIKGASASCERVIELAGLYGIMPKY